KELFRLMGTNDVPALHRILRNAVNFSWGVDRLLQKVKDAIAGTYHAKNFSQLEIDLAVVVYDLGGGAALHALHKSPFAFPCRETIAARRAENRLRISVGEVRMEDLLHNIEVMFKPEEGSGPPRKAPMTLCLDEVASDGRLCWIPQTDDVAGLCEHASTLPSTKMGQDLKNITAISDAIRAGTVHVGQEILVAAFARNDDYDYGAKPVLILPTCKRGSWEDAAMLIEKIRQAWTISEWGASMHGDVVSIASDGDPKRRPALFALCMVREITPHDALFQHVGFLPGINLWTGSNFETQDLDWKHDMKRICKLLCTREGILVNNVTINKTVLAMWLERLTDVDWSEDSIFHLVNPMFSSSQQVEALLSPKDAQDVPRAIKLLSLVGDLPKLDRTGMNPSELETHNALSLLGEMLEALVEPFINPDFTISEQITSLSKFAFLLCALFLQHGTSFMPSHLYSDLQCMIRTAIFRVAHTKIMDPERRVLLCELGDDCLEILFGCVRMIGGHAPNVSPDVFCHRATAAVRLRKIFEIYAAWEMKARRLLLKRTRDADHLSPRNWRGELRALSCDLLACWLEGMRRAMATLTRCRCNVVDFATYFENGRSRGIDLLRPSGGKYLGISAEVDRSLVDDLGSTTSSTESQSTPIGVEIDLDDSARYTFRTFDGRAAHALEKQSTKTQQGFIEHWISNNSVSMTAPNPDLNLALPASKILCVNSSLYATLISTDRKSVSLCVMTCTLIKHKSQFLHSAPIDEITLRNSTYEISGQILELIPFSDLLVDEDTLKTEGALIHSRPDVFWLWTKRFVSVDKLVKKSSTSTSTATARLQNLQFTVNGRLVYPLTQGECVDFALENRPYLFFQHSPFLLEKLEGCAKTWSILDKELVKAQSAMVQRCLEEEDTRSKLLVTGAVRNGQYPYSVATLQAGLITYMSTTVSPPINGPLPCNICGKEVEPQERQNHMGHHILFSQHGIPPDPKHIGTVSSTFPCGFCGQSMQNGACAVRVDKGKVIISSCKYSHPLKVGFAVKSTVSRPCSNSPIVCPLNSCGETHWKYNMLRHLQDRHPNYTALLDQNLAFRDIIQVSAEEQSRMGLMDALMSSERRAPRSQESYDARRSRQPPTTRDLHGASPQRPRHYTSDRSVGGSAPSFTYAGSMLLPQHHIYSPTLNISARACNGDVFS
ncbi:hypothetical protein DFP72DRAFT_818060, partial [Ephemerocybe angulata]